MGKKLVSPVYAYLDESSSLRSKDKFFVVGILCTNRSQDVDLKRIIKRARQKLLKVELKRFPELKFNNVEDRIIRFVLEELGKLSIVVDKNERSVEDTPKNNGLVVGEAICLLLKLHPVINVSIDKRYTSVYQNEEFLNMCQVYVSRNVSRGNVVFNPPLESKENPYIQLVDFVAGAFNYKYNRDDASYSDLINKIVAFEKVVFWGALKRGSQTLRPDSHPL